MEIKKFLEQFIEGYLFCDIENMLKIKLEKGGNYGACGYPIMMTTLSGMELLGDLLSENEIKPFWEDKKQGEKNFNNFWDNYFCLHNPKYKINKGKEIFRILIRHGLAHRFLTLPGIFITIDKPELHWTINPNRKEIWIDAKEFFLDFKNTYKEIIRDKTRDQNEMQKRLNEIMDLYIKDSEGLFKNVGSEQLRSQTIILKDDQARTIGSPAFTSLPTSCITASGVHYSGNFPIFKKEFFPNENNPEYIKDKEK